MGSKRNARIFSEESPHVWVERVVLGYPQLGAWKIAGHACRCEVNAGLRYSEEHLACPALHESSELERKQRPVQLTGGASSHREVLVWLV